MLLTHLVNKKISEPITIKLYPFLSSNFKDLGFGSVSCIPHDFLYFLQIDNIFLQAFSTSG